MSREAPPTARSPCSSLARNSTWQASAGNRERHYIGYPGCSALERRHRKENCRHNGRSLSEQSAASPYATITVATPTQWIALWPAHGQRFSRRPPQPQQGVVAKRMEVRCAHSGGFSVPTSITLGLLENRIANASSYQIGLLSIPS